MKRYLILAYLLGGTLLLTIPTSKAMTITPAEKKSEAYHHYLRGRNYDVEGEDDKAVKELREAARLNPGFDRVHLILGQSLLNRGSYKEAEAVLREARRRHPEDPVNHEPLGKALEKQGKLTEATREYREAVRLIPNWASAHYSLGKALRKQKKYEEAEKEYREALRLQGYHDIWINFGLIVMLEEQGKHEKGWEEFYKAIKKASTVMDGDIWIDINYKLIINKQREYLDKENAYRADLRMVANEAKDFYIASSFFASWGQNEESLMSLNTAIEKGFGLWPLMTKDADLDEIRKEPEFKELAQTVKERWEGKQ